MEGNTPSSHEPSTTASEIEKERAEPAAKPFADSAEKEQTDPTAPSAAPAEQDGATQQPEADATASYPTGLKLTMIVIALQLAVLCVALDNTIISTAIPRITDEFHALSDVGWYGSAYLLPLSGFQLFFGRLYSICNIKWTFLCALFIFELGSLICAVAPTSTALIVGRAIAGLGSAGLFSGALIILAFNTRLEQRAFFNSVLTAVYGIASIVGPLIGGVFTDHVTWRWCFYINLPIGGATAVVLVFFLRSLPPPAPGNGTWRDTILRFDPLGTLLFTPCVVCVLLALQWGGTTYPWSNGRIIALFVVFGVLLIGFIATQFWAGDNATVPIRIARQRIIACGGFFSFCVGAAFFIMTYYIPIWFQAIRNASATTSGLDMLPMMIANIAAVMIAGAVVAIWGHYVPFMYGLVVFGSVGAGLLTTWTVDTSTGKWIGYQILFGAGIGMGMQQTLIAAQSVLSLADVPTGTALMQFSQMFGGSLFVSVAQNIFTTRLSSGLSGIAGVDAATVVSTGATQITSLFHDPSILRTVRIVYNDALMKAFLVALIMNCLSLLGTVGMGFRTLKSGKPEEKPEDGAGRANSEPTASS
ncbi:major facilitator superfamily domain-containing protein [Achaetomium macrosporum]|uniref:Major facilitator superfamily domain-containing protein n=1 Tax=Achaetomium macrosporum TaxID=79813 RepID=A0AAN7H8W4_9PEZI|nr:major facilitator superfamily domain-containing protein [Achaetomium macrosporum]